VKRWMLFTPFALLVVLAGWFGWRMGVPLTETQIIEFYVPTYVRDFGGIATDCQAIPSDVPGARMEISCSGSVGAVTYVVGPRGRLLEERSFGAPEA